MALFDSASSFIGLDIGTSSLKLVELVNRRKRVEVATYAQANLPNLLLNPNGNEEDALRRMANVISRMMEQANITSEMVVAALPSSVVFSTVLNLPTMSDEELDKAIRFAARDVVPSDIDETVLGWSRVGGAPHMDMDTEKSATPVATPAQALTKGKGDTIAIFLTAAPKVIVNRYVALMEMLHLQLFALEVETFPLIRSLVAEPNGSGLIVDIGDQTTTFHIVDQGTPRFSSTLEFGGRNLSGTIARTLNISAEQAEATKIKHGVSANAPESVRTAVLQGIEQLTQKAKSLLTLYQNNTGRVIKRSILIGGGANLKDLKNQWTTSLKTETVIGNPWKGLSYPEKLGPRLNDLGPTYAVAVGLALRGATATPEKNA